METDNNVLHSSTIEVVGDAISDHSKQFSHEVETSSMDDQINFWKMKSAFGWKHAINTELKTYFPRYHIQQLAGIIYQANFRVCNR